MADDLPAVLAEYRDRNEGRIRAMRYTDYTVEHDVAEGDVRRLLKAVEAVLKLADGAEPALSGMPADCTNSCVYEPCDCSGKMRALAWDLDPEALRDTIARELTGKGNDDA